MKNSLLWFAGQYYDQETGLHYNYHRYYDSQIGRYLKADPYNIASIQNDEQILRIQSGSGINAFAMKHPLIGNQIFGNKKKLFYKTSFFRQIIKEPEQQFPYAYVANNPINRIDPKGLCFYEFFKILIDLSLFNPCGCDDDPCKNADEECYLECEPLLGKGGRTNQGNPYRNCWVRCMKRKGCYKGDSPVE